MWKKKKDSLVYDHSIQDFVIRRKEIKICQDIQDQVINKDVVLLFQSLKLEKNFTLDAKREASTTALLTADANQQTPIMNYNAVAFDADGNAIATGKGSNWQRLYPIKEGKQMRFSFFISVKDYDAARWARLKNIVIMDNKSEAYKQAEEQIKANKQAFKDKGKEQ